MRLTETPLTGAWVVELDRITDERGSFARTYDRAEWQARGMDTTVVQCNTSFNARAGTLRGLHYQTHPHGEPKLVRCTRGAVYDVIVDLRRDSPTHTRWFAIELSASNGTALHVPEGMAHGFQTLDDSSEVLYMMGREYMPGAACGVRFDDPAFEIDWPEPPPHGRTMSERDAGYPDYAP